MEIAKVEVSPAGLAAAVSLEARGRAFGEPIRARVEPPRNLATGLEGSDPRSPANGGVRQGLPRRVLVRHRELSQA